MGGLIFLTILIPVTVLVFYFDIRFYRIPNWLTMGAWISGAALALLVCPADLISYLTGSFISFTSYVLINFISKGKLGWGDIKLSLFLGGVTGIRGWYLTNLFATLLALLFLILLALIKVRDIREKIPFGPFLCSGALLYLLVINGILFREGLNNLVDSFPA